MEEKQKRTYTEEEKKKRRDAVRKFESTRDRLNLTFPAGTKARIAATGAKSASAFVQEVVIAELDRIERYKK